MTDPIRPGRCGKREPCVIDAVSTADGTNRWATTYPSQEFPRMTGTSANDDAIFVAVRNVASGGD